MGTHLTLRTETMIFRLLLTTLFALCYACKTSAPKPTTDATPAPVVQDETPAVPALDEPEAPSTPMESVQTDPTISATLDATQGQPAQVQDPEKQTTP